MSDLLIVSIQKYDIDVTCESNFTKALGSMQIGCFNSLLTYNAHSGRVVEAHFLSDDGSDNLVLASADSCGQIHIWDATVQRRRGPGQRPTLFFPTEQAQTQSQLDCGAIMRLRPWGPLLLAATELGGVRGYDPRVGVRHVWSLEAPLSHGVCACMVTLPGAPVLCTGTTRGMMHVWDLRFQVSDLAMRIRVGQLGEE
jgi:hypothetical protein